MHLKKKCLIFIFCLCFGIKAWACDICGCNISGNLFGLLPQQHKHFAGVRYSQRSFDTRHLPSTLSGKQNLHSFETFQTADFFLRYYPNPKVQIWAFVPIHHFSRVIDTNTTKTTGLGDVQVIANYALYQTPDSACAAIKHNIIAGVGLKMPTGDANIYRDGKIINSNLQLGTGTFDAILNAVYMLRYKKIGMNMDANLRISSTNSIGYKFGNQLTSAVRMFYAQKIQKCNAIPQIGIVNEKTQKTTDKGYIQQPTGGNATFLLAGADVYYKKIVLGFSSQIPVKQHLGEGYITAKLRTTANIAVVF